VTRRAVLAAGALAAGLLPLSGCTGASPAPPGPQPAVDPDVALREAAVRRELALLAAYDAALRARPGSAALLRALRAEHAEHLAALGGAPAAPSPSVARAAGRLSRLRALERTAAAGHGRDALGASRQLASVLAALAAAETSHLEALA